MAKDLAEAVSGGVFARETGHEQVVFCQDSATGLKAIIGIYSTALGPALGGTRFYPYTSEDAAIRDVLDLSKAMAYKNSLAGLDLGGGKAVIIGDPKIHKTEALLRAYGRFVQSLGGRYITACDVGTYVSDMDVVAKECSFVTGRSVENGGAGDSSVLTALGVFQGMRACAEHLWGSSDVAGRRVGVAGVGKVGHILVGHLIEAGAHVTITDVVPAAIDRTKAMYPSAQVAEDSTALIRTELDIFAPCALGGAINDDSVQQLSAQVVCGAANNQLAHPGIDKVLADRGILYAPDYLVNSGGVIQVSDELHGFDFSRAQRKVMELFDTVKKVFALAEGEGILPATAADHIAEQRMHEIGRLRSIYLAN